MANRFSSSFTPGDVGPDIGADVGVDISGGDVTTTPDTGYKNQIPCINSAPIFLDLRVNKYFVFIGANGSGKTRLAAHIDINYDKSYKISAHKSLEFRDRVDLKTKTDVEHNLLFTRKSGGFSRSSYGSSDVVNALQDDYQLLLEVLYADYSQQAIEFMRSHKLNPGTPNPLTKLERLKAIWEKILRHRKLTVENGETSITDNFGKKYLASSLSDGERVIFYLIGQCLIVPECTTIIVDEPELHINKAVLAKLWDMLEVERSDCCFIYFTHDLEFAATRHNAEKYVVRNYSANPLAWDVEPLPKNEDLPEEVVSRIVGSRLPILFVEGDSGSLDAALYRRLYPGWTVMPIGSCEGVIHAVGSFRRHPALHRIKGVGLIDNDGRGGDEEQRLRDMGVHLLPVSEVENLLVLPEVVEALARLLHCSPEEARRKRQAAEEKVRETIQNELAGFCMRYTKRHIDERMKALDLGKHKNIVALAESFAKGTDSINVRAIHDEVKQKMENLIVACDTVGLLRFYDNKSLLNVVTGILELAHPKTLKTLVENTLDTKEGEPLRQALLEYLPKLDDAPEEAEPVEAERSQAIT